MHIPKIAAQQALVRAWKENQSKAFYVLLGEGATLVYAETAGAARASLSLDMEVPLSELFDVPIRRAHDWDLKAGKPMTVTDKESSVLLHSLGYPDGMLGYRNRYYTTVSNPTLCALVDRGYMEQGGTWDRPDYVTFRVTQEGWCKVVDSLPWPTLDENRGQVWPKFER